MCVSHTSHGGDGAPVYRSSVSVTPVMEVMVHLFIVSWIAAVKGTITNGTNEMTSVDLCSTMTVTCS